MLLYILPVAEAPWLYLQIAAAIAWITLLVFDVRKNGRKGLRVLLFAPLVVVAFWLAMIGSVLDSCATSGC
jgi:4-hydroxybenzoate polyprenyltransferase